MNAPAKEAPAVEEEVELLIPRHLVERFEGVRRELLAAYGYSPDVVSLVRFWLTCSTISQIRTEFEAAVLQSNGDGIPSAEEREDDGDDL